MLKPKKMKKDKIIYWTATGIVAAVMLWSAYDFSLNEEMKSAFEHRSAQLVPNRDDCCKNITCIGLTNSYDTQ